MKGRSGLCFLQDTIPILLIILNMLRQNKRQDWRMFGIKLRSARGIDAYLANRWIDARFDGGLKTGLRKYPDDQNDPLGPKLSWYVYRDLGTDKEDVCLQTLKQTVGISNREEIFASPERNNLTMEWTPIISEAKDSLYINRLDDIARIMCDNSWENSCGLMYGKMGSLLFLFNYCEWKGDEKTYLRAVELLSHIIKQTKNAVNNGFIINDCSLRLVRAE